MAGDLDPLPRGKAFKDLPLYFIQLVLELLYFRGEVYILRGGEFLELFYLPLELEYGFFEIQADSVHMGFLSRQS